MEKKSWELLMEPRKQKKKLIIPVFILGQKTPINLSSKA